MDKVALVGGGMVGLRACMDVASSAFIVFEIWL